MSYIEDLKKLGCSYLGDVDKSVKIVKSLNHRVMTYCIYLAPATMAGRTNRGSRINVCPKSEHCKSFCLNGSGHNKSDILEKGIDKSLINLSRIRKTKLFYNDRATFMRIMVHEIQKFRNRANRLGMDFAVRINGTSDLSPLLFVCEDGKNILEKFSDVQFYDYTKLPNRYAVCDNYSNYDLTFSYDGYNDKECSDVLRNKGGRVAVVFYGGKLPKRFNGWDVIDGNDSDIRFRDRKQCIIGLHYHITANDFQIINGKRTFVEPNTPFVIMPNDERCKW